VALLLGTGLVALQHRSIDTEAVPEPLTDDQAAAQVVDAARQVVSAAKLAGASGGYAFVSCRNAADPPYHAVLSMNFALPQTDPLRYVDEVANVMVTQGWVESPLIGAHFGHRLTRNGVSSELSRNPDAAGFAMMRLSGECRNTGDHRRDDPAWTEVAF
jgi:hypothetical protein